MINIDNVYKRYKGNKEYSLENITFNVEKNSICGLLGENGAGKSTLLKILSTLYKADKGSIRINGLDIEKDSYKIKKYLSVLFETPRLYDQLTGEENIIYFAKLFNIDKDLAKHRANELYKFLNIDFQCKPVSTYSKGMKQKISFVRSLINDPEIILMDEPTSGLDIISRRLIREYTSYLKSIGKTILLTSHIAEDIESLCDNVIILNKGKVFENDTVSNLKLKYKVDNFEDAYINIEKYIRKGD